MVTSDNSHLNAKDIYLSAKAWSMGFSDANNTMNHQTYISNFNWLSIWLSKHFLKVIEKIFSFYFILFICLIIIFYLRNKKSKKIYISNSYYYLTLFFTFGSIFWFINSPLFRYGSGFLLFYPF